jgi:hypothetical protein
MNNQDTFGIIGAQFDNPKQVATFCNLNKQHRDFCNNKYFWIQLFDKYELQLPTTLNTYDEYIREFYAQFYTTNILNKRIYTFYFININSFSYYVNILIDLGILDVYDLLLIDILTVHMIVIRRYKKVFSILFVLNLTGDETLDNNLFSYYGKTMNNLIPYQAYNINYINTFNFVYKLLHDDAFYI